MSDSCNHYQNPNNSTSFTNFTNLCSHFYQRLTGSGETLTHVEYFLVLLKHIVNHVVGAIYLQTFSGPCQKPNEIMSFTNFTSGKVGKVRCSYFHSDLTGSGDATAHREQFLV